MTFYPYNPALGQKIQGEPGTIPVDRAFLAHYQEAPAAVDADGILAATDLDTEDPLEVVEGLTNPDVPRVLSVKGSAAGVTGDVVIEGTDASGAVISDTIALNGTSTVDGAKAFKTVTKITLPVGETGENVVVGTTKKLGLIHKVYNAGCLLVKLFDGSADTGTLTVSSTVLSQNYFALNGAANGSKVVDLYYIV